MTHMPQFSRRSFVASVAALGGGLALGFHLPIGAGPAGAAAGSAEVNAWVVIQPDDSVVIRVARSEMCIRDRLLPERHDHGGGGPTQGEAAADRRRHRRRDHQHLPMRHLCPDPRGDPHCGYSVTRRRWP